MWMTSVVLVAYLLVPCFQRVYATSCYYPDGTLSKDVPCSSGADSACCGSGAICLSNGLCLSTVQPFGLSRGSCTDPSYKIKECTKLCTNIQRNGGCSIVLYNNTESTTQYCCNSIVNNPNGSLPFCDQGLNTIEVDSASMIAGIAALADYTRIDDSTKTTSSAATPTSPTSNTPDNINSHGSSSHEVAVGVGVGVSTWCHCRYIFGLGFVGKKKPTRYYAEFVLRRRP